MRILLNPESAPLPDEPSAQIAIATALGRVISDHSIAKGMKYLNRMPTEMRILAMRDAAARDRAITSTPAFVRFGVEHAEVTFESGQQISLDPVQGGGTDFRPCFDWIEEQGTQPQMVVFLTDLYGSFPEKTPPYPVLWASTGSQRAPFGQVVPMQSA
jgi:VWA-like protein DUF2201